MPRSFEKFMEEALHHPQRGYYARRVRGVGRRGDFTTAPMLGSAVGRAVAAWATGALRETGCRDLIEIGPGEGNLALEVLRHLPWVLRWRVRLHLVETSAPLEAIQRRTLGRRAHWHSNPAEALAACNGRAVMFSNELVDAFAVRRFEKFPHDWRELGVEKSESGEIREVIFPADSLPDSSGFEEAHPVGQRIEVHDAYRKWLQGWLPAWRAGSLLTIDYGAPSDALYHRRPQGTMRAYWMQQCLHGMEIYQRQGHQDLTADVNFTDLQRWMQVEGSLQSLAAFLGPYADPRVPEERALLDPTGAGGAFMVLEQRCGRLSHLPELPQITARNSAPG